MKESNAIITIDEKEYGNPCYPHPQSHKGAIAHFGGLFYCLICANIAVTYELLRNEMAKFDANNQPANRKSGPNIKAKIIAGLGRRNMTEDDFIDKLLGLALGDGGGQFMSELLKRYSPIPKQSHDPIVIEGWPNNGTPVQKADKVLECMSNGQIPPDLGALFIESISKSLGIEEVTELAIRLEKIEKILETK